MNRASKTVLEADATYEIEKTEARARGFPHSVTLSIIERRFGLRPKTLLYFRNNQFAPCKSYERRHEWYLRKINQ